MYTSLFEPIMTDSIFSPMRTIYVVSDSQLESLKRKRREDELESLELSRKRLEEAYQSRLKIIEIQENKLQEELKALAPDKKKLKDEKNHQKKQEN